jgi:hypothetical protein
VLIPRAIRITEICKIVGEIAEKPTPDPDAEREKVETMLEALGARVLLAMVVLGVTEESKVLVAVELG